MSKEVRVSIAEFGEAIIKVTKNDRVHTLAQGFGCREWGILDERTGELTTNGNDITTNYLEVASQLVLKHLGYNAKIKRTSPCHRLIEIV